MIERSIFFISCIVLLLQCSFQVHQFNIGAIFFENELLLEQTFVSTIERINKENQDNFFLVPSIRRIKVFDGSFVLQNHACDLIDNGVIVIFGPSSQAESDIVSLICNTTGIPHIEFDQSFEETVEEKINHQMTLNVYPSQLILSKAYADIVQNYGWKKFTIIYDADDAQAPARLQDLLQLRDVHNELVRVLKFQRNMDYRIMWKNIKSERRIVLDCAPNLLVDLLNASKFFNLTGEFNHLFLTNLETYNSNLDSLQDHETFSVNITAARLKLNQNLYVEKIQLDDELYNSDIESSYKSPTLLDNLIYDGILIFVNSLHNLTHTYPSFQHPRVTCYNSLKWSMGAYFSQLMRTISSSNNNNYRTTNLQFDEYGQRVNFNIEIFEPIENYGMATWDTKGQITPLHIEANAAKKIIYRVATRLGAPYFIEDPIAKEQNITGNKRYIGYAVDLIDALSLEVGFEYVFVPVPDNEYGSYNKESKQWNGIIAELINNNAHMGICDLTITQARKTVVDFTVPFMQLGISLLAYKKPPEPKDVFAFLGPFKEEVWFYVIIAIILVTILFKFMARISKEEWENPHPCNKDPDTLENQWNLNNTLWLTMGSIMTAGSDILPKSAPMRTFNGMWWIFAVIIANSYTANLAAFLTNSQMKSSITDIKSLVEQTDVKFGTMEGGSTFNFFAESNETVYRLAYNLMNSDDPSAYTKDNVKGMERVLKSNGDYMFLMETTTMEYYCARNCSLKMVGEKFGEKHYAIAVPLGAEYRSNLSVGILKLSERGELFKLKNKWWRNPNQTCGAEQKDPSDTPDMTFEEVRGIFYTLGVGVLISVAIGIGEFLMHTQELSVSEKIPFKEVAIRDIKFVLCIWNNKKPISCTPSTSLQSSSPKSSEKTIKYSSNIPTISKLNMVESSF